MKEAIHNVTGLLQGYIKQRWLLTTVLLGATGFAFDAYVYFYDWIFYFILIFPITTLLLYFWMVLREQNRIQKKDSVDSSKDRMLKTCIPITCFFAICSIVSILLFALSLKAGDPSKNDKITVALEEISFTSVDGEANYFLVKKAQSAELQIAEPVQNTSPALDKKLNVQQPLILDRNGTILAGTVKVKSLYAELDQVSDAKLYSQKLGSILYDVDNNQLLQRLSSRDKVVHIKSPLLPSELSAIKKLDLAGLTIEEEDVRSYPYNNLFSHVIGYIARNRSGIAGLERTLDCSKIESQHDGADLNELLNCETNDPVYLTLDADVQNILRKELLAQMEKFSAKASAGIIIDVTNGEIISMVSLPDFNPNSPKITSNEAFFNRVTNGVYEFGSVFRSFTYANAFDQDLIDLKDTIDAKEPLKIGRFTIRDYHAEKRVLTVPEAFKVSSNIASAKIGGKIGKEKQLKFFRELNLLDSPKLSINEIARPLIPNPWKEINTYTASYGHGIAVSPLSLALGYVPLVNEGTLYEPSIIKKPKSDGKRVLSKYASEKLLWLLEENVENGTGAQSRSKFYKVGGATGTAEKLKNGRYMRNDFISSFIATFPIDQPKYVLFIMFDEPKGIKETFGYATGGWVAAPVAKRVIEQAAPILGVEKKSDQVALDQNN